MTDGPRVGGGRVPVIESSWRPTVEPCKSQPISQVSGSATTLRFARSSCGAIRATRGPRIPTKPAPRMRAPR